MRQSNQISNHIKRGQTKHSFKRQRLSDWIKISTQIESKRMSANRNMRECSRFDESSDSGNTCVCVCVCVRARARARMCEHARTHTHHCETAGHQNQRQDLDSNQREVKITNKDSWVNSSLLNSNNRTDDGEYLQNTEKINVDLEFCNKLNYVL